MRKKKDRVFDDTVNESLKIAGGYDGFIFGAPVYWGSASGGMTSFLGRLFYADLCGGGGRFLLKPAAVVSARRAGTTAAWDQLNKYLGLMQMPIINSRYWNIARGAAPEDVKKDLEGMRVCEFWAKIWLGFSNVKKPESEPYSSAGTGTRYVD